MKRIQFFLLLTAYCLLATYSIAQNDSIQTRQDAIYDRPFIISIGKINTAIGGYLEGNTNYFVEDGVGEGFSMELRRFNIFLYSNISPSITLLSELEFEHGTEEIALETAIIDFEVNPALNFRAGILLPFIGLVNTNHDSPKWEFIDRPLSSTEIIPTTLSEVGFGFYGKFYPHINSIISYDAYLVNGLQEEIILNDQGKTHLPSGKTEEMFGEDNNGLPMYNARIGYSHRKLGEIGLSGYGGVYNRFRIEGEKVAEKQYLSIMAIDWSTQLKKLTIQGEFVLVNVEVDPAISEIYGTKQYGGFIEAVYPLIQRTILRFENSVINAGLRFERIDYNVGKFKTNITTNIGDENTAIAFSLSLRPNASTIIRANYRYHWIQDNLGNPTARKAGFQFGIASYF